MFYCNKCAGLNKWPLTSSKSNGRCEICGNADVCNDLPSRLLPTPEPIHPFDRSKTVRLLHSDEHDFAEAEGMNPYFFTFGSGQAFPGGIVCVFGRNEMHAREGMIRLFGDRWSFCYSYDDMVDYDKKWGPVYVVGEYLAD